MPYLMRKTRAAFCVAALLTVISVSITAQAQQSRYSNNLVHLPRVWADGMVYQVDLKLMEDTRPLHFELVTAQLTGLLTGADSIFADNVLTITSMDVEGIPHWAKLSLVSPDPVVFELLSGGVDDEDDDNDGLDDYFDENPWTPEPCNHPLCMTEPPSTGPVRDSHYKGYTEDPRAPMVDLN
ncbi:MAG: hypothetical protein RKH07_01555 [Gammaproteobacteria bacterium]